MNTPLEVGEIAARIFLSCEAVDVKEPLVDDFLGEDEGWQSLSLNCTLLSLYRLIFQLKEQKPYQFLIITSSSKPQSFPIAPNQRHSDVEISSR